MKRWFACGLMLAATYFGAAGCARQCFLSEHDLMNPGLVGHLEQADAGTSLPPLTGGSAPPPNVDFPERPPRFLSLQEAIAIALESGTASGRGGVGSGIVDDSFVAFQGGGSLNNQTDRIRVLALNPAIAQASLEQSLARFDAQWVTSMNWSATDNLQQGLSSFNNGSKAEFSSTFVKALASGGVANMSFSNSYQMLQQPPTGFFGVVNPLYTSRLTFGIEQPLIQNFGVEINQLLNRVAAISGVTMPGAAAGAFNGKFASLTQAPSFTGSAVEGILIARLRLDAHRAEFERNLNNLLLNVEIAYWKLYQAYGSLYSNEELLRIAHKAWMINKTKFEAGKIGPDDYQPIRGQYEQFRGARTASLGDVLEKERNLRGMIGLPVEDGTRLVPVTAPTMAPYHPNWTAAQQDALNLKPELILARDNVRAAQYNLIVSKNFLKPDLRSFAQYSPVGFGSSLDGNATFLDGTGTLRTSNAWRSLASDHFNDWSAGLTLNIPLGYRIEHAAIRQARLALAQAYELLKDQEARSERVLAVQYQKITEWYRLIEARRAEREAQAKGLEARFRKFAAGQITVDAMLDQQSRLANAQLKEYEAIAEYNNSLARYEWAKGSIRQNNNVIISEGPLPVCAQVRAVEHERDRTKAIVLRQPALPRAHPGRLIGDSEGTAEPQTIQIDVDSGVQPAGAELPAGAAPSLGSPSPAISQPPVTLPAYVPRSAQPVDRDQPK